MPKPFIRSLTGLLLGIFIFVGLAPKTLADATNRNEGFYSQTYQINSLSQGYNLSSRSNSSSGAYVFSLPLSLAPGRSGLNPDLNLNYNSQAGDTGSFYGLGWSMDIPSISRINKLGVDRLYSDNYFSSSMDGELVPHDGTVTGEYGAKYENGGFMVYEYSDNTWVVTDKSGTTYTFGSSAATRQDDPSDSTQIYKWMLEEIRDTNDNFISYEYIKDQGQIYPSSIVYTGHGSTDGPFEVNFTLETRPDSTQSYSTQFEVITDYRVESIETSMDGTWQRNFSFNYTNPDNSDLSLLESITESARSSDGTVTTLEPTQFTYQSGSKGWSEVSGYQIPVYFYMNGDNGDKGVDITDVNGDGLLDLVNSMSDSSSTTQKVYINAGDGSGWFENTSYSVPVRFWEHSGTTMRNTRMADVNGDGHSDILRSNLESGGIDTRKTYVYSEVSSTWVEDSSYSLPLRFNDGYGDDKGIRLLDINGDSFPDFVQSLNEGSSGTKTIYLFDPEAEDWNAVSSVSIPVYFNDRSGDQDEGVELADVNGDGLVDIVESRYDGSAHQTIYVNRGDGTGWTEDSAYTVPVYFWDSSDIRMDVADLVDVNGDSLQDIVYSGDSSSENAVYINRGDGTGWSEDSAYTVPLSIASAYGDPNGVQFFDVDGDGLSDVIQSEMHGGSSKHVYVNQAEPLLLSGIESPKGASTSITYDTSTNFDNPDLPFAMTVVNEITVEDGLGSSSSTEFSYQGGTYFYEDELNRRFGGFESITARESGKETVTYYHQDSLALIGRSYKTEIYDGSGNLFKRMVDVWETDDIGHGALSILKSDSVTMDYDGGSGHRDTAVNYVYDANGNISTLTYYGEVDADEDGSYTDISTLNEKFSTVYVYATDASGIIRNKVSQESTRDHANNLVRKTRYYYDSAALNVVSIGNLTNESVWNNSSTWHNTYYTYNAYGNLLTVKNPRGYITTYTYDSKYLYPATSTNPKSYSTSSSYDYGSGQISSYTDENGGTSQTSYDGLGRVLTVSVPNPSTGALTTLSTTTYNDSSVPNSSTTTTTVDGVSSINVTYYDGLGRIIQSNSLAEDSLYTTVDTWYNDLGLVEEQSLPYSTSSSAFGRDPSAYSTTSTYDALNRPLTVTTPTGSTSTDYSQWESTVTDPNGISKVYSYDASGHLIAVEEQNDGATYTSSYEYDSMGQLVKITDAQGNIRNFTYDYKGLKVTQEDLHDSSESSFGTWSYTYDKNNNMLTQTDPAGQTVTWAYDQLDRPTYEDWDASTTARNYTFVYDTGTRGRMKLYQAKSGLSSDLILQFSEYDYLGNPTKETRSIMRPGLTTYWSYLFTTTYDLLSRPTKVVYPSSALTVNYTYNATGALEKVTRGTTTLTNVVSDLDYAPTGQVSSMTYGNGMVTTNTYDAAQAYRLTSKETTGIYSTTLSGGTVSNVQDLTYSYDSNGNITGIVDASSTPTAKTLSYVYDDLNRLTSASTSGRSGGDYSQSYTYDEVGNLTYKSDVGTLSYSGTGASGANPHAVTSVAGTAYSYDSKGNVTSDGTHSYTWDQRNRLSASGTKTFSYDHSGSRYKIVDSSSGSNSYTYYVNQYEELRNGTSASAGTPSYYIFAAGQRVATLEGGAYTYTVQDHLGGTALTANAGKYVTQIYDYYPYGSELSNTQLSTTDAKHSFTDKELDDSLGLYYFEARWYDADIGRFTSQDPLDGMSYTYGANNPLVMIDPTGLYNVETGDLEEGDTKEDIVASVNEAYGITTTWEDIAAVSYIDPERSIGDLLSSDDPNDKFLAVGTSHVKDVTGILDDLNTGIADAGLNLFQLISYANNGGKGDLKNWGDSAFGTGKNAQYWAYIYHGQIIRQDAPGNIHLGYEAGAYGVPQWAADFFGDITNNQSGGFSFSGTDDSYDSRMAQWGYEMATNPYTNY